MAPADSPWTSPSTRALRLACAVACVPSGGALLAYVYGLATMRAVTLWVFVPCAVGLIGVWAWGRRGGPSEVADALVLGSLGGLIGTVGYDLIRIPFKLAGLRVFAPIEAYGVWIAGAAQSSVWTDVFGWSYHFSNGITFGILYALMARGRHWGWGVAWAMLLETIALVSPFGPLFNLPQNPVAIGIAYLGHIAYGVPLGLVVQRWDAARAWVATVPRGLALLGLVLGLIALGAPALNDAAQARDARRVPDSFVVEGERLNPGWVRLAVGDTMGVVNPMESPVYIDVVPGETLSLGAGERAVVVPDSSGIRQIRVQSEGRTHSSFLIVEPADGPR